MAFDPFDRAIPGESLTKPMQDDPIFEEPKVDNLTEAHYQTIHTLRNNTSLYSDLMNMIEAGVDLESIANIITFGSFSKGQYSPDVAMQLKPLLVVWMFLEAHKNGIEVDDIKIMNFPKDKSMGNLTGDDMLALMRRKNPQKYGKIQKESATTQLDDFFAALNGGAVEEEPQEQQMSFMDMQQEPAAPEEMENV